MMLARSFVSAILCSSLLALFQPVRACGRYGTRFPIEPVAGLLKSSAGTPSLLGLKKIQLKLPQNVKVHATIDVGLNQTDTVGTDSGAYVDNPSANGCPHLTVVPCLNYEYKQEHNASASSQGWSFSNATYDNVTGTLIVSMMYQQPEDPYTNTSRSGKLSLSLLIGVIVSMAGLASFPFHRRRTMVLALLLALGMFFVYGNAESVLSTVDLHMRLFNVPLNTTVDLQALSFTCPDGGCSSSTTCKEQTDLLSTCTCGWIDGRLFTTKEGSLSANIVKSNQSWWSDALPERGAEDATKASRWQLAALSEHASVASFSRVSLELMAVGAPASLVEAAHLSAVDEIRHARAAFALARSFGSTGAAPSALPLSPNVEVSSSIAEVAHRTFVEACMSETEAVALAKSELAERTITEGERKHLLNVVADEARHAALAWRTIAWAMSTGQADVRQLLQQEYDHLSTSVLAEGSTSEKVFRRRVAELVTLPWLSSLLSADTATGVEWTPRVASSASASDAPILAGARSIAQHLQTKGNGDGLQVAM